MSETDPTTTLDGTAGRTSTIDWSATLAEHGRWLRTVVRARLGEDQAIDEVLQDVSLAAVSGRRPPADPGRVAPWLYRLAVRQSLLYRRKRGRQRKLLDRYARVVAGNQGPGADPLRWLLDDERGRLVREALDGLPERDREIMLLKYTEGWSYRELADRLGISESAVEARLHRVRRKLRDRLASTQGD